MTDNLESPVSFTLSQSGATGYTVYDYFGNVVTSGSQGGTLVVPTPPVAGWQAGWYRIRLTGPNTDAAFGNSYGATNFSILRDTTGFQKNPVTSGWASFEDFATKGVLGFGISRLTIKNASLVDASNPTVDQGSGYTLQRERDEITVYNAAKSSDSVRTQPLMVTFPNGGADKLNILDAVSSYWAYVYQKDGTVDPTKVFVQSSAGTTVNTTKLRVYYPDAVTLVETWDNMTEPSNASPCNNAATGSAYIRVFTAGSNRYAANQGPTAIGNAYRTGVIATVTDLYPRGVTRYEGPSNEPRLDVPETLHAAKLFQDAVHAGNASAIAMGPCPVDIRNLPAWTTFLAAGGGAYCDEVSFHAYNSMTAGDVNLGRTSIELFLALLATYGQSAKTLWHTEALHTFTSVYGVYHPRRSRIPLLQILLWEQYGLPRERNIVWYDKSSGFWNYPAFLEYGDGSLAPYAVMLRVLAEETYEKTHHHRIDFGSVQANAIFLGSVYANTDDTSTAVVMAQSYIPSASVTFTVTGTAAALTVVDGFGNTSSVAQSSGRVTVALTDIPAYVRLPVGVRLSVYSVNDWGPSPPPNIGPAARSSMSGTSKQELSDYVFMTDYPGSGGVVSTSTVLPDSAQVLFNSSVNVDRVIVFACSPWQNNSTLVDFDIQTTVDGTNWTTRKTVTKTATSTKFGTNATNVGCYRETFWDEQWIFDEVLPATYSCTGVRIYVRATSYGGEPDAAALTAGGQGASVQYLTLQEIIVPSASTPALYTSPYSSTVLADSPAGYWRLGEASGTTAVTQVNSPTIDGAYVNGPTLGLSGATAGNTAFQALQTPTNGVMSVANNALLNVGDVFTYEFWANGVGTSGQDVCGKGVIRLRFETNGKLQFKNNTTLVAESNAAISSGWHHFVVTKNGATTKIYQDGVDVTTVGTNVVFANNTTALTVGGASSASVDVHFLQLDEFALYPTALTQAQALTHFQAAGSPSDTPTNTTVPALTGTAKVGRQIQCSTGVWGGTVTGYTYQWQNSPSPFSVWTNIVGATRSDYLSVAGDVSKKLRCNVSASNIVGAATAVSSGVTAAVVA